MPLTRYPNKLTKNLAQTLENQQTKQNKTYNNYDNNGNNSNFICIYRLPYRF